MAQWWYGYMAAWAASMKYHLTRLKCNVVTGIIYTILMWGWLVIVVIHYHLMHTRFWWVTLILGAWTWWDRETPNRGGRRWSAFRELSLFKLCQSYFPITAIKTKDLSPKNNYIFGYHPHGICGIGPVSMFLTEAMGFREMFPGLRVNLLTTRLIYLFPFYREIFLALGASNVSDRNIRHILSKEKGNVAVIVVGGSAEAMDAWPGSTTLSLKGRKGFVRLALQTGAHLVPVYGFGENDLFVRAIPDLPGSWVRKFESWFQKAVGVPPMLFYGRHIIPYWPGWIPLRSPLNIVVGAPIEVSKNPYATESEVDMVYEKYLSSLEQLFNQHKERYGSAGKKLVYTTP